MRNFITIVLCAVSILFYINVHQINGSKQYDIYVENFTCIFATDTYVNASCGVKRINNTFQSFVGEVMIRPNVSVNNLYVALSLSARQGSKNFVPIMGLRNITIDLCRYTSGSMESAILDTIMKDMKKYTNLFHPCPYTGHLFWKDFVLDDSFFPSFLPASLYWFDMYLLQKEKNGFKFLARFQLFAKLSKKSYRMG